MIDIVCIMLYLRCINTQ